VFSVDEGKLLGHIISIDGVKIYLERVEAIKRIPLPKTKKSLQSFLGQINFFRRFIPNLAKTIKPILNILKKYVKFEWIDERRKEFDSIKDSIGRSPMLIIPNYSKYFQIFSFPQKTLL